MKLRLDDILDLPQLQRLFSSFWAASKIPMGIIDAEGRIQVSVGWQQLCTEYHVNHPKLAERCLLQNAESLLQKSQFSNETKRFETRCASGLIDLIQPLVAGGERLGFFYLGQFLFAPPDLDVFRQQALDLGFPPEAYLDMVQEVPVVEPPIADNYFTAYLGVLQLLCQSGWDKWQAQAACKEIESSEQTFQTLFSQAHDGIAICDFDGRLLEANQTACDLFDLALDETRESNLCEFLPPGVANEVLALFRSAFVEGRGLFETELLAANGTEIPIEIAVRPVHFHGQNVILCSIRDLRERREAERRRQATEERFRLIFEKAGVGIVTTRPGGHFSEVNPQFCRFLGYSPEELAGLSILDVTAPEDRPATKRLVEEANQGLTQVVDAEKRYLRKDGSEVWGRVIANYLGSETGAEINSVAMVQDISRRKQMETALQESEERFRNLVKALPLGLHQYVLKPDGSLIFSGYNQAADIILGLDNRQFVGEDLLEIFPEVADSELSERYREVCRTGQSWHCPRFTYQGAHIQGVFELHAFRTGPGRMACLFSDITERTIAEEKLRNSEATLRGILAAAPVAIGLLREQALRWVNPRMTEILGYPEEELIGKSNRFLYATDEEYIQAEKSVQSAPADRAREGEDHPSELHTRWRCRDGKLIDVLLRTMPTEPADPAAGAIFIGLDISELKRTVEELRVKEQEVRLLLECSGEAIYGVDQQGNCTFANPTCLELLGLNGETEIVGRNCHQLFHHTRSDGSFHAEKECRIYEAFRSGDAVHSVGEFFWRRDGTSFPVEYWSHPMVREGEVVGSVVNFIDITERKQAEDSLLEAMRTAQQARAQASAILRSAADAMIVINLAGQVVLVNEAAERLLGQGFAELKDRPLEELVSDQHLLERVAQSLAGVESPAPFDLIAWTKAANEGQTIEARVTLISGEEGTNGALITLRDVTRERQLDRLKDEFISTAAHELRTPMTSILGYTELLLEQRDQLDADTLKEFLTIIFDRSNTLATIIGDMLDLSRVQSGRLIALDLQIGELDNLLRQSIVPYRSTGSGHNFRVQLTEQAPLLIFDPNKLAQVLDNLLSNAVKFSPDGGTISVRSDYGPDDVLVTIEDQGRGMTPDQVERVFDKFYRADSSSTSVPGLGLGMSLVKMIIEGHGGKIWVQSEPGQGTSVKFTLPLPAAGRS